MTIDHVSFDDDFEDKRYALNNNFTYDPMSLMTIKVDQREDAAAILNTKAIALSNIASHTPSFTDKSLENRVTLGAPSLSPEQVAELEADNVRIQSKIDTLEEIETHLASDAPAEQKAFEFPNLAWEAVKAGLAKERQSTDQLNRHIEEAQKLQKDIDLLLDFSAELITHKDEGEMSEKLKNLLSELKGRGIDLWKSEEMTVSKEKLSELKSLGSAQVDKLRSNLQIIFTTKIQVLIQTIGAIMDTLKDIIRNNTKLINTANRLPGH